MRTTLTAMKEARKLVTKVAIIGQQPFYNAAAALQANHLRMKSSSHFIPDNFEAPRSYVMDTKIGYKARSRLAMG